MQAFEQLLLQPAPTGQTAWVGAFDLPFGLPRVFIDALKQCGPAHWKSRDMHHAEDVIRHLWDYPAQSTTKSYFQQLVDGWGTNWGQGTRPAKLPHRVTDTAMSGISSTSPLQTRYVPVGKMYVEGFWRLVNAPVNMPVLRPLPDSQCHAFEGYPALLAHEVLQGNGPANSYKNDAPGSIDPPRLLNRLTLIDRLEQGHTRLALRLKLTPAQRDHIASDTQGDRLDAVLCMLQAAWAARAHSQGDANFGLPSSADPMEGWILTV